MPVKNLPAPVTTAHADLPEMRALSTMQQRFVIALMEQTSRNPTEALKAAGWEGTPGSAKTTAWRYMHSDKVQRAIRALIPGAMLEMAGPILHALYGIAMDPQHKGQVKALLALKDYIAPIMVESKVTHEHTHRVLTDEQIKSTIKSAVAQHPELAAFAKVYKEQLVTDAEYEEVVDLSDLKEFI
jgi:hypothetical protein